MGGVSAFPLNVVVDVVLLVGFKHVFAETHGLFAAQSLHRNLPKDTPSAAITEP